MLGRWTATLVMVTGLAWPTGAAGAEPRPAEPAPAAAPEKRPDKAPPAPPARVPDGVFEGTFAIEGGRAEVHLVVAGGVLVDGSVKLSGQDAALPLAEDGAVARPTLLARGERGSDYVRLAVDFFDEDRGAGTFDGVLRRHRVSGSWTVERR